MEKVQHEVEVEELATPVHGYKYNVREKISTDGGETFYYVGMGRFCKTLGEAIDISVEKSSEAFRGRKLG